MEGGYGRLREQHSNSWAPLPLGSISAAFSSPKERLVIKLSFSLPSIKVSQGGLGKTVVMKISLPERNPVGRTGMVGRGLLGRWGPNHAADPVVTRYILVLYDCSWRLYVLQLILYHQLLWTLPCVTVFSESWIQLKISIPNKQFQWMWVWSKARQNCKDYSMFLAKIKFLKQ